MSDNIEPTPEDNEEFKVNKDTLREQYQQWYREFQAAREQFDQRLDEINEKYEEYFSLVEDAIITSAYYSFPEHANEIYSCEPYPEHDDRIALSIYEEEGKLLASGEISIEEIHELAIQYFEASDDEPGDEIEDTEEYFFEEHS